MVPSVGRPGGPDGRRTVTLVVASRAWFHQHHILIQSGRRALLLSQQQRLGRPRGPMRLIKSGSCLVAKDPAASRPDRYVLTEDAAAAGPGPGLGSSPGQDRPRIYSRTMLNAVSWRPPSRRIPPGGGPGSSDREGGARKGRVTPSPSGCAQGSQVDVPRLPQPRGGGFRP